MLERIVAGAAILTLIACGADAGNPTPNDAGSTGTGGAGGDDGGMTDSASGGSGGSAGSSGSAGTGGRGGADAGATGGGGSGGVSGSGGASGTGGISGSGGVSGSGGTSGSGGAGGGGTIDGGSNGFSCDPLPPATGTVINVIPTQMSQLPTILSTAPAGATILFGDGTYSLTERLNVRTTGLTLRSKSGNASAVNLDGIYVADEIISISASNVTIAEMTVTHAINHPIHISPSDTGPDVTGVRLYRLRIIDGGEQFVKVNPNGARTFWVDNGRLECSTLQLTDAGRPHVVSLPNLPCYTGGIDAHSARGWVVRRNRFEGFWCEMGLSEHAIHFWNSSRDTLAEHNTIVNSAMGIGFGLGETGTVRNYPDNPYPGVGFVGHYDGIIRNNVIYADIPGFDTGIALEQARGVRVYHNTIFTTAANTGFFTSIDYRFANTVAEIRNNLLRRISMRDGATGTVDHNFENVPAAYFMNPAMQDLHLVTTATNAIDKGMVVTEAGLDMDGVSHGASPDLGAYELR